MTENILFNSEARIALQEGVNTLANAVKITLGPKGRNVIIGNKFGYPHVTKDGVTVAKSINLKDPFQNIGAQLLKEVASKTGDDAGDGTTTATILAQAIINIGMKNITAGANPIDLKRGIDKAVNIIVKFIKENSEKIGDDYEKIKNIATISANNDLEIGTIISEAMQKVTTHGVITVEQSSGLETYTELVNGIKIRSGYSSPYFINNTEEETCTFSNPSVLLFEDYLENLKSIIPILDLVVKQNEPLLLVVNKIDNAVLDTLVLNKVRTQLKICVIEAPYFGDSRHDWFIDMSKILDTEILTNQIAETTELLPYKFLGNCEKVSITRNSTILVNGSGDLTTHIEELKKLPNSESRISDLTDGVAIINVGAASEIEMKEKLDRIDDALCATRAAIEEGIVPGGGVIYIRASKELEIKKVVGINEDENIGINIVKIALKAPFKQILLNAGSEPEVVLNNILNENFLCGYDAKLGKIVNMYESGIIDPAKVSRVAIESAASIAGMFLLTECIIDQIQN